MSDLGLVVSVSVLLIAVVSIPLLSRFIKPRCTWCRSMATERLDTYGGDELWRCTKCQHQWWDRMPRGGL